MSKLILDACCGGRMFWFNHNHPNVVYQDIRVENKGCISVQPNFEVAPNVIGDFREMPYNDKTFKLVVFDPPHLMSLGEKSWMRKKYGVLNRKTWRDDLKKGFSECWRVLDDYGVLVFKWNETEVSVKDVLKLFNVPPLFGHPTAKHGKTKWMVFMKIPEELEE